MQHNASVSRLRASKSSIYLYKSGGKATTNFWYRELKPLSFFDIIDNKVTMPSIENGTHLTY